MLTNILSKDNICVGTRLHLTIKPVLVSNRLAYQIVLIDVR